MWLDLKGLYELILLVDLFSIPYCGHEMYSCVLKFIVRLKGFKLWESFPENIETNSSIDLEILLILVVSAKVKS